MSVCKRIDDLYYVLREKQEMIKQNILSEKKNQSEKSANFGKNQFLLDKSCTLRYLIIHGSTCIIVYNTYNSRKSIENKGTIIRWSQKTTE